MFSHREKVLLVVAALAVTAILVVQFAVGAAGTTGDPGRDIGRWKALQKRVANTEARLKNVTISESEAATRLLRAAQGSSSATGVTITAARPRRPAKTSFGCVEHALEIQVTGGFPTVARFMFDLEAKNPSLRIARVSMSASDDSSDRVRCAIIIAAYSPGEIRP